MDEVTSTLNMQLTRIIERQSEEIDGYRDRESDLKKRLANKRSEVKQPNHLSREEIAIIFAYRGKVRTIRQAAEVMGVSRTSVQKWKNFRHALQTIKRHERMGKLEAERFESHGR